MKKISRKPRCVCYECGCPYGAYGFHDLIVPDHVWKIISPKRGEGGLLCPTCIIKLLEQFGFEDVPAYFASGPAKSVPYPETKAERKILEKQRVKKWGKTVYRQITKKKTHRN